MNIEALRQCCLSLPAATEDMPFDDQTLAFRVMNKIFALMGLEYEIATINLKCDPERAIELREQYPDAVKAGYHMNKKHWNTVVCEGTSLSDKEIQAQIRHSYELIVKGLKKAEKEALNTL